MGKMKPDGFWKEFGNLEDAIRPIAAELGGMPMNKDLAERGLGPVMYAIYQHGGFEAVRARLGLSKRRPQIKERGYWDEFAHVRDVLVPIIVELGRMPTWRELLARADPEIATGINNHGGLIAVRTALQELLPDLIGNGSVRNRRGYWKDFANVERIVRRVVAELGRMPNRREMTDRGFNACDGAISVHHGGYHRVEERLGLEPRKNPRGFWADFANIEAVILPIANELGRMPTQQELMERKLSAAVRPIGIYGGFPAVAARLGLGPVTDDAIATHADALAKIVPALGVDPTILWSRMKHRWLSRDLDAAVATHATTGSLEPFSRLLAD